MRLTARWALVVPWALRGRDPAQASAQAPGAGAAAVDVGASTRFAAAVLAIMAAEQALLNGPVVAADVTSTDAALAGFVFNVLLITRAPLQLFHRYVLEDMEYGGYELRRGEQIGLLYGSANRDSQAFDRPDEFDVARAPNRHLAFGAGVHFCLGAQLARLELEVLLGTLLSRLPMLRLDGEPPRYRPGLVFRGLEGLNIRW